MENFKLTIMSILQALMLGCLGRDFVGKQSRDAFSFSHKWSVIVGLPSHQNIFLLAFLSTFWHPC